MMLCAVVQYCRAPIAFGVGRGSDDASGDDAS